MKKPVTSSGSQRSKQKVDRSLLCFVMLTVALSFCLAFVIYSIFMSSDWHERHRRERQQSEQHRDQQVDKQTSGKSDSQDRRSIDQVLREEREKKTKAGFVHRLARQLVGTFAEIHAVKMQQDSESSEKEQQSLRGALVTQLLYAMCPTTTSSSAQSGGSLMNVLQLKQHPVNQFFSAIEPPLLTVSAGSTPLSFEVNAKWPFTSPVYEAVLVKSVLPAAEAFFSAYAFLPSDLATSSIDVEGGVDVVAEVLSGLLGASTQPQSDVPAHGNSKDNSEEVSAALDLRLTKLLGIISAQQGQLLSVKQQELLLTRVAQTVTTFFTEAEGLVTSDTEAFLKLLNSKTVRHPSIIVGASVDNSTEANEKLTTKIVDPVLAQLSQQLAQKLTKADAAFKRSPTSTSSSLALRRFAKALRFTVVEWYQRIVTEYGVGSELFAIGASLCDEGDAGLETAKGRDNGDEEEEKEEAEGRVFLQQLTRRFVSVYLRDARHSLRSKRSVTSKLDPLAKQLAAATVNELARKEATTKHVTQTRRDEEAEVLRHWTRPLLVCVTQIENLRETDMAFGQHIAFGDGCDEFVLVLVARVAAPERGGDDSVAVATALGLDALAKAQLQRRAEDAGVRLVHVRLDPPPSSSSASAKASNFQAAFAKVVSSLAEMSELSEYISQTQTHFVFLQSHHFFVPRNFLRYVSPINGEDEAESESEDEGGVQSTWRRLTDLGAPLWLGNLHSHCIDRRSAAEGRGKSATVSSSSDCAQYVQTRAAFALNSVAMRMLVGSGGAQQRLKAAWEVAFPVTSRNVGDDDEVAQDLRFSQVLLDIGIRPRDTSRTRCSLDRREEATTSKQGGSTRLDCEFSEPFAGRHLSFFNLAAAVTEHARFGNANSSSSSVSAVAHYVHTRVFHRVTQSVAAAQTLPSSPLSLSFAINDAASYRFVGVPSSRFTVALSDVANLEELAFLKWFFH